MKLTIERAGLLKSLAHVQSVVEKRNTIPILSNLLLRAEAGGVDLTATDLDIMILERTEAEINRQGATTVPAHTLYEIVRRLPEGAQLQLEENREGLINLRAGRSSYNLSTLPAEDFPAMGESNFHCTFTLPKTDLKRMIERTRFAISTEETRYYLNGVYFHAAERDGVQVLRAVATDGHRLALSEMPLPFGADGMPAVILPRKTVAELYKLLDEAEGEVHISLSESRVRFTLGGIILTSKLIDGAFPDYERVIPTANDKIMQVDRRLFMDAVDRVSIISSEKSRAVKLHVKAGLLTLSAHSPEHGSAVEEIEASYDGEPLEIGFNARYLTDIAQQIEGAGAQFEFSDAGSPALIRDAGEAGALYVIMPMRV